MLMDVISVSAVDLTRNNLCGGRLRRAGTAVTRSAMLLLAAAGTLAGARVARADEVVVWGAQSTTPD
ncbi:MAG: hypothetical protein DWI10_02280 [Planctomycetota bacterium]|jgi:hypothetical protein|nr:MAG: hypothetical protein DWI10_02280 [Planctomycetota bacterium]